MFWIIMNSEHMEDIKPDPKSFNRGDWRFWICSKTISLTLANGDYNGLTCSGIFQLGVVYY